MTDTTTADHDESLGYADAVTELDAILRELESSDVDVDRLAERVTRAATLIALCRERITRAQVEIRRVTTDLDAAADAARSD